MQALNTNHPLVNLSIIEEVQLSYCNKIPVSLRPVIRSPQEIYNLLLQVWDKGNIDYVEEFKVILMNRGNSIIGIVNLSKGGVTGTVADPKIILQSVILSNSTTIILSHNHPSGTLKPSAADECLTSKIKEACSYFDVKVLDHIIVTSEGYFSFSDEGLI